MRHKGYGERRDGDSGWETIVADIEEGRKAGVTSTPAFFINGRRAEGVLVPKALRAFIEATVEEERSR